MSGEMIALLGLGFTTLVQLCVIVWWASRMTSRVEATEKDIERIVDRLASGDTDIRNALTAIAQMGAALASLQKSVERIEGYITHHGNPKHPKSGG